ncbi:hypothetical protein B5F17_11550 [Butyricicoccus pullicaecorum]|uniref:SLH domain-containing protein n=1 Tax=Butyricicoccus pullicaecorum TaxID=501571 RepID=A0A1Y4L522_9FIRM|nr:S-layer homology domain-containing protein [Butyricicoccus pullicaecorum]OUP51875.1 hypothetical protein B5F17_11550 [Butyricicoccus pullicaecorum]
MRLKRLISAFITCAMLMTFIPAQAFAVNDAVEEQTETVQLNEELVESDGLDSAAPDTLKTHIEDKGEKSIALGESITLSGTSGWGHKWESSDSRSVSVREGWWDHSQADITAEDFTEEPVIITHKYKPSLVGGWKSECWEVTVTSPAAKFFVLKAAGNEPESGEDQGQDNYYPNADDTIEVDGITYDETTGLPGFLTEKGYELLQDNDGEYFALGGETPIDGKLVEQPIQKFMDALYEKAKLQEDQDIVWYVMKDQEDGYHVDGYVSNIPVDVTYVANYPDSIEEVAYTDDTVTGSDYSILSLVDCGFQIPEGYEFAGWKLKNSDTDPDKTYRPGSKFALRQEETFVAQWEKNEEPVGSTDGYFYVLKPGSQDDPTTTDPQHFYYVGKGSLQETPEEKFDFDNGVKGQISSFPKDWPAGADEIKDVVGKNFENVFWYRVSLENGANSNDPENPALPSSEDGKNAWHIDGILMPEDPNYQVRFILRQDETETVLNVYDIESGTPISDQNIADTANKALEIGKPGEGYVVQWKTADNQIVTDEQIISATENAQAEQVLVFYAEFTELVQPAMPTVQDALAVYKKTVVAPESAEPFQPTAFQFKLEKQNTDGYWDEVSSLTGKLSTVPVSQSVQNLTIAGTTDVLEAGTYRLSEIQTAEDLMSWEENDRQFEFTVTDDGKIVRDEEATVFVNTYLAPDLSIEKALTLVNGKQYNDGQSVQSGDVLTYQITVKNDGNKDARGPFNVTDSMWSGNGLLDSVEFTNANEEISNSPVEAHPISGGTIVVQEVPAGSQYVFTYHYTVQMADEGKTLSNTVKLTSSDVDINDSVNVEVEKTHCTITYEYQSGTAGKQLPTDLLPAVPEAQVFHVGDLMNEVPVPGKTTIETEDGTWQFMGWYSEGILLNLPVRIDKDMHVIGLWNFYEYNTHDVKVQYVLEDGADEVTLDKATLSAKHNASWEVSVSETENLADVSDLAVARTVENNGKHYAFKGFQGGDLNGKVTEDLTIIVVYGLDEIGGGSDQKQPDGVPDGYQATVTYRVVNGTWSDGTELDRTEVFDLYSFDDVAAKWVQIPNVTLGNTIPTGMLADANYVGQRGAWSEDITSETAVKGDATYIYRFGDAAADEIVVYYDDDGSGYGEVTSAPRQVFTEAGWQTIPGSTTRVRIHLTATAEDDGGRTYFDEWQGSLVDNLDRDITENENLDVWVEAEIGQTYTIIANFDRDSGGGAHHPDAGDGDDDDNDRDDDTEEIIDEEVPLAETPWLNTEDHYAYIIGYSEDGTVRPNANITRAEVATIFFRLLTDEARDQFWMTSNNFSDVLPNDWYNNAVSTMVNMGIIQGYEDGTFRPNANITRAEFAAIAARFMASGYGVEDDLFTDIANHWARESINDAAMAGWINGYEDGTFRPDAAITRAEAVTLVNNVLQRKPDADHMLDSMIKWPDNSEGTWYYEAIQEATNSHDYDLFEDAEYETWTALQENRDWAALEKDWANAHSA